jgi:predicted O-methyltransferase YrrM
MSISPQITTVIQQLESTPGALQSNWCVPRETGRFLYLEALLSGAKTICEVGTSIGYSTLWLAAAVSQKPQGQVHTIEYFENRQSQAKANIEAASLTPFVTFHTGQALDILRSFSPDDYSFDLAFIDAAKKEYLDYAKVLERLMPSGGCLIADNTRSHREEMTDFLAYMESHPQFDVAEIETPNGQLIARKR